MTKQNKKEKSYSLRLVSFARPCRIGQDGFISSELDYHSIEPGGGVQGADTGVSSVQEDCDKELSLHV